MDRLLTAKDIQRIFSCSRTQAYYLINSDGFPSITVNKRIYVEENELHKWLESHRGKEYNC